MTQRAHKWQSTSLRDGPLHANYDTTASVCKSSFQSRREPSSHSRERTHAEGCSEERLYYFFFWGMWV